MIASALWEARSDDEAMCSLRDVAEGEPLAQLLRQGEEIDEINELSNVPKVPPASERQAKALHPPPLSAPPLSFLLTEVATTHAEGTPGTKNGRRDS